MSQMRRMTWVLAFVTVLGIATGMTLVAPPLAHAQATVGTGSIQGTILDPQGNSVPTATVIITAKGTGSKIAPAISPTGQYNSGPVTPGEYIVRVEATGFKTIERAFTLQIGEVATGNFNLEIGASSTVVTVEASTVHVNTEQFSVQGVMTQDQIENMPINGRNFLDLAQLEPGVQIQDGSNFDPTKVGFSSISFGGRFGRTARIEVDGVDISDETVGTTTTSVPASALQEFQLSQSGMDLSQELTSSGGVNISTRSGTNNLHGQAFGLFRDSSIAARLPGSAPAPFQRSQFGGNLGGPVLTDKLFFFLDAERTKQELQAPVPLSSGDPLVSYSGGFSSPFRETNMLGRLDYNLPHNTKLFYKYSYFQDLAVSTYGAISFQPFKDKNYTRTHTLGSDFTTGAYTHSIRFEYLLFQNNLTDYVRGTGLPFANFPLTLNIGEFSSGPNYLAPQTTPQSSHQVKYDGSRSWGAHIVRYGIAFNHVQGGGFAKFFSLSPSVYDSGDATDQAFAAAQPYVCPGGQTGAACPYNYPIDYAIIGNGMGFSTENPAFGFPLGGLGPDNRLGIYLGDSWKVKRNLTVAYGVRYVRDTGRTDSDLNTIQALNNYLPGFGNPVKQANGNLAPQVGLAWDPRNNGKMVVRAGIGMYYENVIWNNVLFDRPGRLAKGGFLAYPAACASGTALPIAFAGNPTPQTAPVGACGDALSNPVPMGDGSPGTAAALLAAFQTQYQAAAAAGGTAPNPNFIGNLIQNGAPIPFGTFAPGYKTPRSIQMNVGVERELRPGLKLSVDYVRNVSLHYLLSIDANHTGDAAYLNLPAAQAAISATNNAFGCGTGFDATSINCAIAAGARISNYAGNGLDSPSDLFGGGACVANGGFQCAFGGLNPNIGAVPMLFPVGRSVYNAMDVKLAGNVNNLARGIRHANFQVSYTLSRFINSGGNGFSSPTSPSNSDQDFVNSALDYRNPNGFSGPSTLDRKHQLNFGGFFDLPAGFRLGFVSHFWSALPTSLQVPTVAGGVSASPGEIFFSDFTGDGTVGDLLPGTTAGNFGRGVPAGSLNAMINAFNATANSTITPAGQTLVNAGLFTQAQLLLLGAHPGQLATAPSDQATMRGLRAFDLNLSWQRKFRERVTIAPSMAIYNLFNFANFDLPSNLLIGSLSGATGSINGTHENSRNDRVGVGTGVFGLGAPRVLEFGLKLTF